MTKNKERGYRILYTTHLHFHEVSPYLPVGFSGSTEIMNFGVGVKYINDLERPTDIFLSTLASSQNPGLAECNGTQYLRNDLALPHRTIH